MAASRILWRTLERAILGPGKRNGLSVLIFHRVRKERDPLRPNEPTESEFEDLIAFLSRNFRVAPLYESVSAIFEHRHAFHSVAITFDDGYADNAEVAFPVLRKYGVPATFFVASGLLDGGVMWNDRIIEALRVAPGPVLDLSPFGLGEYAVANNGERRQSLREIIPRLKYLNEAERVEVAMTIAETAGASTQPNLMMTSSQLAALAVEPLADIGGHTVSHPILKSLPADQAFSEIADGKARLEELTGTPLKCFAFPNGVPDRDYNREHVSMVRKAGFEFAVSTSPGGVTARCDRLQLPRFTPWDRQWMRFGIRMLTTARKSGVVASVRPKT